MGDEFWLQDSAGRSYVHVHANLVFCFLPATAVLESRFSCATNAAGLMCSAILGRTWGYETAMKALLIVLSLIVVFSFGCTLDLPFLTHELKLTNTLKHEQNLSLWCFADLKGDGYEHLITVYPQMQGSALVVLDQEGKSVSQINISNGMVNSVTVLENPIDRTKWMFYSINDGKALYLRASKYDWGYPFTREDKSFEPYPREDKLMDVESYTWNASLTPHLLEDIDGDGQLELVVLASDSYSVNPRGLMVFDFASGALKWFFQSPTSFRSLLFEDFDGDGQREFVLSNVACKNTVEFYNGLDDLNGYVLVVDAFGQLRLSERLMTGLSDVMLQYADLDQNGQLDIIVLSLRRSSDSSAGAILYFNYDGQRLIRKKELLLPQSLEPLIYPDFLLRLNSSLSYQILLNNLRSGVQLYDDTLELSASSSFGVNRIFDIGDFKQDSKKELLVHSNDDKILLLDHKLKAIACLKNPFPDKAGLKAELVAANAGSKSRVVISCASALSYYELAQIPLPLYLYRTLDTFALWLSLLLLLIIIWSIYLLRARSNQLYVATLRSPTGFIVVNAQNRIIHVNKAAINLALKLDPSNKILRLQESFPQLCEPMQQFRISKMDYEDLPLELGKTSYKVHIDRLPGHQNRHLISLSAPPPSVDSEMLNWAETARRLSHHVRRHITNVILALDPLEDQCEQSNKEYLQIVRGEIEKIRIFTHAFQRFTEMRNYELKLHDLVPSVEHALKQIQLPAAIKLIKNYSLKSVNAYLEPIRFEEALINTFNNATEAMPEGGTLHISIRIFDTHQSPKGNLSVLIEVEDTGKGIPTRYMQDIWKPFFTTKQFGTGIGIPETRKILDSMGGLLDIQSEESVGTTVSFWLKGEYDV